MVVGCITNIVLDALFIMVFNMGIQGAAIATVTSQLVTAIWGMSYYLKGKSNLNFRISSLKLDRALVLATFAIGSAPFAMQIAASCVQIICNNSLKTYGGDLAIGAMATINSVIMMVGMPIVGISQGAQPIVGFNYGAKKYDRAQKTLKICMISATLGLGIGWLLVQFVPQPIVSMFNSDKELVRISVYGIRKYLSMMPLIGVSMIGSNYFQSIGKAKQAMFLSLLRQVILLVPMMLILPRIFGLNGVWFAQPIADLISFTVTAVLLYKELKTYKVIISTNEEIEWLSLEA
jgi:Na+-driven multidrug efflux pump